MTSKRVDFHSYTFREYNVVDVDLTFGHEVDILDEEDALSVHDLLEDDAEAVDIALLRAARRDLRQAEQLRGRP